MKLYIGNLPWNTTEQEIRSFMTDNDIDLIDITLISDRDTGRFRGFGFATIDDPNGFNKALDLNGSHFGGRQLIVNEARPKPDNGDSRRDGRRSRR